MIYNLIDVLCLKNKFYFCFKLVKCFTTIRVIHLIIFAYTFGATAIYY